MDDQVYEIKCNWKENPEDDEVYASIGIKKTDKNGMNYVEFNRLEGDILLYYQMAEKIRGLIENPTQV